VESDELAREKIQKVLGFSAFLGIILIEDRPFLLFAEDVKRACIIQNHQIYSIVTVALLPFDTFPLERTNDQLLRELITVTSLTRPDQPSFLL
jgi:hypothetical protein